MKKICGSPPGGYMRSIRDRLTGRGRYILGGVLAFGVIATVVFAATNRIGTSHTSPPAPNVKTTSIAKIVSQGKLSHIGSTTPANLPTASPPGSTFPYSSGGSLATHARQAAQYAVTNPQGPRVTGNNGAFTVTSVD